MASVTMENVHVHLALLVMTVQIVLALTNVVDMELVNQVFVCVLVVERDMIVPFQNVQTIVVDLELACKVHVNVFQLTQGRTVLFKDVQMIVMEMVNV